MAGDIVPAVSEDLEEAVSEDLEEVWVAVVEQAAVIKLMEY